MLDEGFPLFGEELDLATRMRDAGLVSLYTPAIEIVHEIGVSRSRARSMLLMHSNEHLPLLPAASRRGLAARHAPARLGHAPPAGRARGAPWEGVPVKAVVLVGGEGTRLRPLTETMPKPLLPLVDRPFLDHVLDHLARHGVTRWCSPRRTWSRRSSVHRVPGLEPRVTWITETATPRHRRSDRQCA